MPAVYIQVYCMGNLHSMMNTGRPASHSRSHDCKSRVTPYSLIHVPHRRPTLVLREGERERAGGGGGGRRACHHSVKGARVRVSSVTLTLPLAATLSVRIVKLKQTPWQSALRSTVHVSRLHSRRYERSHSIHIFCAAPDTLLVYEREDERER